MSMDQSNVRVIHGLNVVYLCHMKTIRWPSLKSMACAHFARRPHTDVNARNVRESGFFERSTLPRVDSSMESLLDPEYHLRTKSGAKWGNPLL